MRPACSLYVDVGYLLAAAATRVTGTSLRKGIHANFDTLISALCAEIEERSGVPTLRVHWYDSAHNGVPDPQQERIGELSRVKLRLGRFGVDGQQKGVDLRIGLDLVTHARHGTAEAFYLVSGDDDLTEAVEEAQVHGVRVIILAVPNSSGKPHAVSRHLIRAADELTTIPGHVIDSAVMKVETVRDSSTQPTAVPSPAEVAAAAGRARPTPRDVAALAKPPAPATRLVYEGKPDGTSRVLPGYDGADEHEETIAKVVSQVLASYVQSASGDDLRHLRASRPSIPGFIDRALLLDASDALAVYDLSEPVRYRLRNVFWDQVDEL